jgi:hypothetical protein
MMRGYLELYKIDHNKDWVEIFQVDADDIWNNERDIHGLLGKRKYKTLIDQAGMLEMYARFQEFLGSGKNQYQP